MARGIIWKKEELDYLKDNYSLKTTKELQENLKRSQSSIRFVAYKLRLKKDFETISRAKKRTNVIFSKEILNNLYNENDLSVREIAKLLKVGKTTVEYYFKKFNIKRRNKSDSSKLAYKKYGNWKLGKTKANNEIVARSIKKMKDTCKRRRFCRIEKKETEIGMSLKDAINNFYWRDNLTQEKIAQKIGISRFEIIQLMKKYKIQKKPNFRIISSLRGENHSQYGRKWDLVYTAEIAKEKREKTSLRCRKMIIKRLQNNEMPATNTEIERKIARELSRLNVRFVHQYPMDNRFVCDFAIPEHKIIIECDGDYWHANPSIYKKDSLNKIQQKKVRIDKIKNEHLKENGWLVLRFFESEINRSLDNCVGRIKMALADKKSKESI